MNPTIHCIKLYTNILFFIILFSHASCTNSNNIEKINFQNEYTITVIEQIEDSIIPMSTFEYLARIKILDTIGQWEKYYFTRTYNTNGLEVSEELQTNDSIKISFILSPNLEIKRITNWNELYNKIENPALNLTERAPEDKKKDLTNLVKNYSLDSILIVNKNTYDIQIMNLALNFLYNEDSLRNQGFELINEGKYLKMNIHNENKIDIKDLLQLTKTNPNENTNINMNYTLEIYKNKEQNTIEHIKYKVYQIDNKGIMHEVNTYFSLN